MTLPRFSHGAFGALKHFHLNEAFDRLDQLGQRVQIEGQDRPAKPREYEFRNPFLARAISRATQPLAPLQLELEWDERGMDGDGLLTITLGRSSHGPSSGGPPDPFDKAAYVFCPPNGLLHVLRDVENGPTRYLWQSAPSVHLANVTAASGPMNATYTVRTVDNAIEKDGLVPIDRWAGIDYSAKSIDAKVLLVVGSEFTSDVGLIAFETPELFMCPPPGP